MMRITLQIATTPHDSDQRYCDLVMERDGAAPTVIMQGMMHQRDADELADAVGAGLVKVDRLRSRSPSP
jgi:hypothetical protein